MMPGAIVLLWNPGCPELHAQRIDFGRDIRPILSENCFYCHGQDANKRQAGLRLDLRDSAIEGDAIVPGSPDESALIERILSDDPDMLMPPADSHRQLGEEQKKLLVQWIDEGASYEPHWAFVSPQRPKIPAVASANWIRNPVDAFVLSRLEEIGASPSPEADRNVLIKRLYADLTGLPPSPAAVEQFINDPAPDAYEKLVDQLLADPHYGERLALPWLDAARYADSNGFQQDGDTWQWIWRDWVVRAFNDDLPFDQFTIWQLAGDLLPDATTDQKIASGFNRNPMLNGEGGAIAEEQRFNVLFDRVDTTATNWLGLTIACAQCHDHKYDPVTQREYYQLLDLFNRVPENGVPQFFSSRIRVGDPVLELPTEENRNRIAGFERQIADLEPLVKKHADALFAAWRSGLEADGDIADLESLPEELRTLLAPRTEPAPDSADSLENAGQGNRITEILRQYFDKSVRPQLPECEADDQTAKLKEELAAYRADQIPRPMIMADSQPRKTHILDRGNYLSPLEEVAFDTPAFLPPMAAGDSRDRLGFARWLVAPENPLTARVQVNRMWQYFFGTGLVRTTEDLGVQSEYPAHRQLLDWLAVEFREGGWRQKRMHRLIVTSATYRQSSRVNDWHVANDPENRLFSRASRIRMPAMVLRDWALACSGLLDDSLGGAPVYPYQPDAVWEALAITKERDFTYPRSSGNSLYRRSLYTFWRRTMGPTNMFDASNRQTCRVRATLTSTPLHALTTLNDPTWVEASRFLAERAMKTSASVDGQIGFAFEQVLCRSPNASEQEILQRLWQRQSEHFAADPAAANEFLGVGERPRDPGIDPAVHAALSAVCLAIFNLDEALVRE